MCGVILRDRMRYSVISERCGVKYYVVKRESFGIWSCEKGNVSIMTRIHGANVGRNVCDG